MTLLSDDIGMTVCAAFQATVARVGDRLALRDVDGTAALTYAEYGEAVRGVAGALAARGVGHGDRVALMIPNSPAFHVIDSAALHLGAAPFAIYATSSPEQIAYQLGDAEVRVALCAEEHVESIRASGHALDELVVVGSGRDAIDALAAEGVSAGLDFEATWRAVQPEDLATLVYTSGTTGPPKGVQLTHTTVLTAVRAVDDAVRFPDGAEVLSYLPLAHVAERNNSHWFAMSLGFTVHSCADARRALDFLPEVRPTWFFGVPRVFEKMKAAIEATEDTVVRDTVRQAVAHHAGDGPPADATVLEGVRARLGLDRAAAVNVGGAPATPELLRFFHAIGIPLGELWGMSELNGAGTLNRREAIRIGTVGQAVVGIELRIGDDGELQVRGPCVTPGYFNRPDQTAEATTPDRWFRTGDVGEIDADGYLRIVDRIKELIINTGGKNMSPTYIESRIRAESLLVGQMMVVGDRRPYNVALIGLDRDGLEAFARERGLPDAPLSELAEHPSVLGEIADAVARGNERLSRVERIKRYRVVPEEWVPGKELTPTMKLRRRLIVEAYEAEIGALYD